MPQTFEQTPVADRGAQTESATVDNQIQPNTIPMPATPTLATPTPATPAAPTPSTSTPPSPQQIADVKNAQNKALHAGIFSKIFSGLGTQNVVMPDGSVKPLPQNRSTIARSVVAGALAGMFTKPVYRQGEFGEYRDVAGSLAQAGAAGAQVPKQRQQEAQEMIDKANANRLKTYDNNMSLFKNMIASSLMKHEQLDPMVKMNQEGIVAAGEEYEKNRDPNDKSQQPFFVKRGLEDDEVLASGHKLTDHEVILTGTIEKPNPKTGVMEPHPLYDIINPNAQLKLTKDQATALGKYVPGMENSWDLTRGNLSMTTSQYNKMSNYGQSYINAETFANGLRKEMGLKPMDPAELKKVPLRDILSLRDALGHTADQPDLAIDAIKQAGGNSLLNAVAPPEEMAKFYESTRGERLRQEAINKLGGIGAKAPAPDSMVEGLRSAIQTLDPEDQKRFMTRLPLEGQMTRGEVESIGKEVQQAATKTREMKLRQGDPAVLDEEATNMIQGDLTNAKDVIAASRSNPTIRAQFDTLMQNKARALGLDPTRYTYAAQEAKYKMYEDYSGASTKTGQQLVSFNTFLDHAADAVDASDNWKRSNSPLLNRPLSWIAKNAEGDPNYTRFVTSLTAPAKEYMNFLNANRAEHEADIKIMSGILGANGELVDQSPRQIMAALSELSRTADIRAANLGNKYVHTVGSTYPNLIEPNAVTTLKKLGVDSRAAVVSGNLPRGWANGQPAQVSIPVAQRYFKAAGGDKDFAAQLMKENGWMGF